MRNKGYSKCDGITKAMRNLTKKSRTFLSYSDHKKICKCAPRDIMKIRKYCRTIKYTYMLDLGYFRHVHKGDIVDLCNSTFGAAYLKAWRKVPTKYDIVVLLRDNDDVYKRLVY
jgi:hypothetical protein